MSLQAAQNAAVPAAKPLLFKPGQAVAAARPAHTAAAGAQTMDFHASVGAYAEQLRGQQLKLKQAAVKAENELDRLKALLQREQTLQVPCADHSLTIIIGYHCYASQGAIPETLTPEQAL